MALENITSNLANKEKFVEQPNTVLNSGTAKFAVKSVLNYAVNIAETVLETVCQAMTRPYAQLETAEAAYHANPTAELKERYAAKKIEVRMFEEKIRGYGLF